MGESAGRELVAALALIDRPATAALLAQVCDRGVAQVQLDLQAPIAAGVVLRQGRIGQFRLAHPAAGRIALGELDAEHVQALHLRIATAYLRDGGSSTWHRSAAARHLISSGSGGLGVAQACLDAALWEERREAFDEAEELASYGLDSQFDDPRVRVGLLLVLGRSHGRHGRMDAARGLLERAVDLSRDQLAAPDFAAAVVELATVDVRFIGPQTRRIGQLEEALAGVDPGTPLWAILTAHLSVAMYFVDLGRSRQLARDAIAVAEATGDQAAIEALFTANAFPIAEEGSSQSAERMLEVWNRERPFAGRPVPLEVLLATTIKNGDRAGLDYGLARLRLVEPGLPVAGRRGLLEVTRLSLAVMDGDAEEVARLVPLVRDHPSSDVAALGTVAQLIWQLHGGERIQFAPAMLSAMMPTTDLGRLLLTAAAAVAVYNGDEGAMSWLVSACESSPDLLHPRNDMSWLAAHAMLGFIGGVLGDHQICRTAIAALQPVEGEVALLAGLVLIGPVGWFLAWAHWGIGDPDAALRACAAAEAASRRLNAHAWVVQCMIQRTRLLADRDLAAAAAQALLARAEASGRQLGHAERRADALIAELQQEQLPAGGRHHQILRLAADGMTNEQIARSLFLSVSTVERHFTQIYRTLGVRNRAEAVAAVASGGPSVPFDGGPVRRPPTLGQGRTA